MAGAQREQEITRLRRALWKPGHALALGVAFAANRAQLLTVGGATCAVSVGALVHAGAGWRGSFALIAYFLTASALGRLPSRTWRPQRRGSRRDAVQVLANGGVPAIAAVCALGASPAARPHALACYAGAVAAATADTWSTEIGIRYGGVPRSIVSFRPLPVGASGGASAAGLLAALAGSALIAAILVTGKGPDASFRRSALFAAITIGGAAGSLSDSLLGATVQEVRHCPTCGEESELLVHHCGAPTRFARGLPWCNNDAVNLISIATGAATAMAIFTLSLRGTATYGAQTLAASAGAPQSEPG